MSAATNSILDAIAETGSIIVAEHGIDPTTAEFEKVMYDSLFQQIGYRGNCNARIWSPGSKPGPRRPVWFTVTKNGRVLTPVSAKVLPPNFQEYWYSSCRNFKDEWANAYMRMLTEQGRAEELLDFQSAQTKGTKYLRIGFGLIAGILFIIMIRNMTRIK
jgi:hypothetical protein